MEEKVTAPIMASFEPKTIKKENNTNNQ